MEERRYIPAMEEQIGFLRYFRYLPACGHNICARVDFDDGIDEALLRQALETGFSRLPYCQMRLHKRGGKLLAYFSREQPQIAPTADLQKLSEGEVERYFTRLCKKGLPEAPYDTQLYAAYPARIAGNRISLLFISSHLITDGYSQMYCLMYAFRVYDALKSGAPLPPPGLDPVPYMEKETYRFHCTDERARCEAWWTEELKREPVFTSVNGCGSREFIPGKNYGRALSLWQSLKGKNIIWRGELPAELVRRVEQASREAGIPTQDYYMLALRSYLAHVCRTEDVMFYATVSRRGNYVAKHCGLMLANILPFRSIVGSGETCAQALKKLKGIQLATYRHALTDLEVIKRVLKNNHGLSARHCYDSVWFTYQPYYKFEQTQVKFRGRPINGGLSATPLYIYLMPEDTSGALTAEYCYCASYVKLESVQRLHRFVLRFLDGLTRNPELTVGELTAQSVD